MLKIVSVSLINEVTIDIMVSGTVVVKCLFLVFVVTINEVSDSVKVVVGDRLRLILVVVNNSVTVVDEIEIDNRFLILVEVKVAVAVVGTSTDTETICVAVTVFTRRRIFVDTNVTVVGILNVTCL